MTATDSFNRKKRNFTPHIAFSGEEPSFFTTSSIFSGYGVRYLESRTGRWLSADPAMGEYIPSPGQDTAKLPGLGGIYNTVNFHTYAYSFNNPVRYTDPNGESGSFPDGSIEQDAQWDKVHGGPDVTFTVHRDHESYKTTEGRNRDLRGIDRLTFTNNKTGESVSIDIASVPNMADGKLEDAVAAGDIYLSLGPESKTNSKYAPSVLTISGGKTISGEKIDKDGRVPSSRDPYRVHDSPKWAGLGCFTGLASDSGGPVKNVVDSLKSWGVRFGGTMKGILYDNSGNR